MAAAYIAEVQNIRMGGPAIEFPIIREQVVSIAGSHNESLPFSDNTQYIRVNCDAICSIAIGPSAVATTNNMRLAANQTEYFQVRPGQVISVISNV